MKKVFLAILTLLYISASTGFILRTNYCTGTLADHCKSKICNKCGSEKISKKDNLCCRNENRFVKNNTDQNIPEQGFRLAPLTAVALPPFVEISFNKFVSAIKVNAVSHAPPPGSGIAIYLRDRVFRI